MKSYLIRSTATGWKFDLKAANGQIIATSEIYRNTAACRKGIASVRRNAPLSPIADLTAGEHCPNPRFEVYLDKAGQYRFRLRARNGSIIAVSENYTTKSACLDGIAAARRFSETE